MSDETGIFGAGPVGVVAGRRGPGTSQVDAGVMLPSQRAPAAAVPRSNLRVTTVLLVDPDRATREPLKASLTDVGIGRIVEAPSVAAAEEIIGRQLVGDLALVSLQLGTDTARLVHLLREAGWPRIIALAPTAEIGPVIDAVGSGVSGVLIGRLANPSAAAIPATIHDLSSREIEVIRLVADGRSNKWIGDQLSLSALTVKSHLARIGRKLGTGDRAHMVALAMRAGVIA